jgi:uncharacterized membrane protein
MNVLLRAAALGVATGGRSASGLAALAFTTRRSGGDGWVGRLGGRWGRGLTAAAALGEILADKSPLVPSRLSPPALVGRLAAGWVAGTALARREGVGRVGPALVTAAGVVAGSVVGARWRAYAADRGWNPVGAALAEDVAVITLAGLASRR